MYRSNIFPNLENTKLKNLPVYSTQTLQNPTLQLPWTFKFQILKSKSSKIKIPTISKLFVYWKQILFHLSTVFLTLFKNQLCLQRHPFHSHHRHLPRVHGNLEDYKSGNMTISEAMKIVKREVVACGKTAFVAEASELESEFVCFCHAPTTGSSSTKGGNFFILVG